MPRPYRELDWNVVERMIEAGCSGKEIASAFRIHHETFYGKFKQEYGIGITCYIDTFRTAGKANLRLAQYMTALKGNTNMLIKLGELMLGQGKDLQQIPPNQNKLDVEAELMLVKDELREYKEKFGDKIDTNNE